ncbi:hypothetical protein MWU52_08255 [Jannaschia sp. S6380]|uniref:hypothetical protein n=1 Tax=Jannaschia sp. S6380 TaxID=2926408 RepID=UPI001FF1411C|nr:hypothetical protein [Jannaschia sp. S6380]MCK0167535.1 hypothetical protein [Jannaschia sp. S6380]
MDEHRVSTVEDYTKAFLGMAYPVLLMALIFIWALWAYAAALSVCVALHWTIRRLALRRARAEAAWDARVARAIAKGRSGPAAAERRG